MIITNMTIEIINQNAELVRVTDKASYVIEKIARVCYNSESRMVCPNDKSLDGLCTCDNCNTRNKTFLQSLMTRGHESIFEHAYATFKLTTDRGISHELVRHRLASYMQSSTRYINYSKELPIVLPLNVHPTDDEGLAIVNNAEHCRKLYTELIARKFKPEEARDVLPTCTATTIFMTANFRQWKHVIKLRTAKDAHPKIQELLNMVRNKLTEECPVYFG